MPDTPDPDQPAAPDTPATPGAAGAAGASGDEPTQRLDAVAAVSDAAGPDDPGPTPAAVADADAGDTSETGPLETGAAAVAWGAATHAGQLRTENEDAYVAEPMVFGVADGMGGHAAGEVASGLAASILRDRLGRGATHLDVAVAAVVEANAAIFQSAHANAEQRGMGTTLTAMAVLHSDAGPDRFVIVNVGDSRTYVMRDGVLRRATTDHSYVQELVATGHITEAEARAHPRRNIVTRALGIEPTVRVDAVVAPMVRGDRYLLCSDGLVDEVPDEEIEVLLSGIADPQAAADELVAMANRHGGRDNVTVVVVDVLAGAEPAQPGATGEIEMVPAWTHDDDDAESQPIHSLIEADALPTLAVAAPEPTTRSARRAAGGSRRESAAGGPRRRRLTPGTFLFFLALAAIVTVTITLALVAVNNSDDGPPPTTTTTSTSTTTSTTTTTTTPPSTTAAPSTAATTDPGATSTP